MKAKSILDDIEKLLEAGEKKDALTILKAYQRETLIEFRIWYRNNFQGDAVLYAYYIDKFIEDENS